MNKQDNNIWIGVEDLSNDQQFLDNATRQEFFELPIVDALSKDEAVIETATKGANRRDFLKYTGFSLAAATLAASCEIPVKKAIPYVVKPDAIVPGVAAYYASTYVRGGDYCSILVKTREGRPIKVEGNTMSPITKGGTSARVQASVLDLYDTARVKSAGKIADEGNATPVSWSDLDKEAAIALKPNAQVRILTNTVMSPSLKQAMADFTAAYPNTQTVTYDAISYAGMLDANEASFGQRVIPSYHFDQADTIVSFGADFLGTWISPIEFAADFAKTRKTEDYKNAKMSRFYQFESFMSMTGSNADHRVLVKPSEMGAATLALYNAVAAKAGQASVSAPKLNKKVTDAVAQIASDLWASQGKSLIVSGSNDKNEQTVVNAINNMLGNYGTTVDLARYSNQRQGSDTAVQQLMKDMNAGTIDAVIVYGDANPVYDLPNGEAFGAALKKVGFSVSLNGMFNETSANCGYVAPDHNYLEAWGDVEAKNGSFSLVQPTISPLFETRSAITSLLTWAGSSVVKTSATTTEATDSTEAVVVEVAADTPEYDYIKSYWQANVFSKQSKYSTFQMFWDSTLHDGVFETEVSGAATFAGDVAAAAASVGKPGNGMEVAFFETINIGAGQYANNPWLQEMPDPVTRHVWDNVLCIPVNWNGKKAYKSFNNLEDGDYAELTVNGKTVKLAVVRMFGMKEDTFAVALGYGRSIDGPIGKDTGSNLYPMLSQKDGYTSYFAGAEVSNKKGEDKTFACVQHHHTMGLTTAGEDGAVRKEKDGEPFHVDEAILAFQGSLVKRSVIRQTTLGEITEAVEELVEERHEFQELNSQTLYPGHSKYYDQGHHWSMSIDMSACIGCGACSVACMAENNVPVVGKKEVSIHHEMSWLRIDRYYYGDAENPNVVYQPMLCQHCDNAPCENVCPVAATNHSSEGLNQMTYNRCIGTRYCANNCPYKVRRFNWLDYTTADIFAWNEPTLKGEETPFGADDLTRMVLNPDVTVRSRGVIEKCSFCVQRIQETKLTAKVEQRKIRDGELKVACQTACPTGAIVFGDDNDPNSAVSKAIADKRSYKVLEEVNTQASVNYLIKVTNKNEKVIG